MHCALPMHCSCITKKCIVHYSCIADALLIHCQKMHCALLMHCCNVLTLKKPNTVRAFMHCSETWKTQKIGIPINKVRMHNLDFFKNRDAIIPVCIASCIHNKTAFTCIYSVPKSKNNAFFSNSIVIKYWFVECKTNACGSEKPTAPMVWPFTIIDALKSLKSNAVCIRMHSPSICQTFLRQRCRFINMHCFMHSTQLCIPRYRECMEDNASDK